jgi:hypothetical protein
MSEECPEATEDCPEMFYERDGDRWLEFWCIEPLPHPAHRLKRTGRVVDSVPENGVVLKWEQRPTWRTAPE